MVNLDKVQPQQIALNSRVVLESPRAWISRQKPCGTEMPDSSHNVHEVQIWDRKGEMQHVQVLFDGGTTSMFMPLRILKQLGISHEAAHITTLGWNRGVMQHAKDRQKTRITVQYLDYLSLVDELDVLVVPMQVFNLVPGLPWFYRRNPDIDCGGDGLTSLQSLSASGVEEMIRMTTVVASKVSEPKNDNVHNQLLQHGQDTQTLGANVFNNLPASDEIIASFALQIGECAGLLGATLEGITLDSPDDTDRNAACDEQGAAAVVAADEPLHGDAWMTASGSPRLTGRSWLLCGRTVKDKASWITPIFLFSPPPPCSWTLKLTQIRSSRRKGTNRQQELRPSKVLRIRGCL